MAKNMPVGVSDFKKLIDGGYYFVDKTKFIQEIMTQRNEVTLITRPRRFGKTLNLSMLEYFFNTENATENRKLFSGLYIENTDYMQEQGTRPIIFLTLKDIKEISWEKTQRKLASNLAKLYNNFVFLLKSDKLTDLNRKKFLSVYEEKMSYTDMEESLENLCEMLYLHYGKKAILLIDEYDTPIISAWHNHFYDECIQFMRNFFSAAFKDNKYLDFAVLTGITRVSKESIFSGLNNLAVCGVLSKKYSDCFGFTLQDVQKLVQDSGYSEKMSEVQQWYDGYKFGNVEIYNPWSIINFVSNECEFKPYWINVSDNAILRDILAHIDKQRYDELKTLLKGNSVDVTLNENIIYSDLGSNHDALFMMLLHTGYLKAVNIRKIRSRVDVVTLKIPNCEIQQAYEQEILQYTVPRQGETILWHMLEAMINGNSTEFENILSQVLIDIVSCHDAAKPENFYHGLLLGFSVLMTDVYRVESNRESGLGRFDIAFFPIDNIHAGVILELKAAKSDAEMAELAKKAVKQIQDKAYCTELKRQGVTKIWKYGISFYGKKVHIERD